MAFVVGQELLFTTEKFDFLRPTQSLLQVLQNECEVLLAKSAPLNDSVTRGELENIGRKAEDRIKGRISPRWRRSI